MHPLITSHHNPKIRNILALEKSRERMQQHAFVIEGMRELILAAEAQYKFSSVFFCPDITSAESLIDIVKDERLLIPVERSVFEKLVYRESTEGVIAVAGQKEHLLENIALRTDPIVLIVEGVEKPGNLGAILRTADAANLDAVIICDAKTDFYNRNVIRSSVGCLFAVQTASASAETTLQWLKDNHISILATDLQGAKPYHEIDYTPAIALVMGTESTGVSGIWREHADARIIIPMRGKIDSMNVSNAAAVIVFEAMRQRGFK